MNFVTGQLIGILTSMTTTMTMNILQSRISKTILPKSKKFKRAIYICRIKKETCPKNNHNLKSTGILLQNNCQHRILMQQKSKERNFGTRLIGMGTHMFPLQKHRKDCEMLLRVKPSFKQNQQSFELSILPKHTRKEIRNMEMIIWKKPNSELSLLLSE